MKAELINLLATEYKEPVILQGALDPEAEYPAGFFTVWNTETPDGAHYDNDAINFVWYFDVNYYSTNPTTVNERLASVRDLLRSHGWIVQGLGFDVPSGEPTHTGRGITVLKIQNNSNGGQSNDQ